MQLHCIVHIVHIVHIVYTAPLCSVT